MAELNFTPAYSEEDKTKVAAIVAWLAADDSRTGADLCRATDIKEGTRSSILNGSYASSPTKFLDKMLDAIDRSTERHEAKTDIPFTETSVAKLMIQVCRRAHVDRDFGILAGRVGVGKTSALREYVKRSPSAVLVEAFEGIDHSTFIRELATATGLTVTNGTTSSQTARLINQLKSSDCVILVDEANHLPKRSFGALRRISDVAGIGIVLVGTQELLPMVQDPDGRFGQISSRIGYWPAVIKKIELADAQALIRSYFKNDVIPAEILKAFYDCCEGSARTLRNLLRNVYRKSSKNKVSLTVELIHKTNADAMAGRGFTVRG